MNAGLEKLAYAFSERHAPDFDLNGKLGGKGKSLALMTAELGMPVPPGFTLTTDACRLFMAYGWTAELEEVLQQEVAALEKIVSRKFGAARQPLLLSVRSGSSVSMPGMMDTVLNVGLCRGADSELQQFTDRPQFAADCRVRLEQTFAKSVGLADLPEEPFAQLRTAVKAVFHSWNGDRARSYRRIEGIDDRLGTAVTVQSMVFGNLDDRSGTGVVFSRNPSTGTPNLYGDVLFNAQGEDVVSGAEKTLDIAQLVQQDSQMGALLTHGVQTLERYNRDLVEVEFTIESGVLWMLQYRTGKRSPVAAVKIAHDMALDEGFPLSKAEAVTRTAGQIEQISTSRPAQDPGAPLVMGLAASPGIVSGSLVLCSQAAVDARDQGRTVILARSETSPSDVEGIAAAAGLLTARGGLASHAAVVARGWGKPAVVGCEAMVFKDDAIRLGDRWLRPGETITIDGASGAVFGGKIEIVENKPPEVLTVLQWRRAIEAENESSSLGILQGIDLSDDAVVVLLHIKGYATREFLLELTGESTEALEERLARLSPLVDESKPRFMRLTTEGALRAKAEIAANRAAIGSDRVLFLLEAFGPHNLALKKQVTGWQSRLIDGVQTPNDHLDTSYDLAVIAQVRETHSATVEWLSSITPMGEIALYVWRLNRALQNVEAGDHAHLVSPRVDSYHNVWFELHEYLIQLAGRIREQEDA